MKWLDRRIAAPGPFLCLCLSEADFLKAARHCNLSDPGPWMKADTAHATTHYWECEGQLTCIVTMRDWEKRNGIEIAGLLIHEAVHVCQKYFERIGEVRTGAEQEAYAVQSVAQELMAEFARQVIK